MAKSQARLLVAPSSPLSLETFWIDKWVYREEDVAEDVEEETLSVRVSRPEIKQKADDRANYRVRLRCQITVPNRRSLDVTSTAVFRLETSNAEEEDQGSLIMVNAPVMLLGALRGMISTFTSVSGFGRLDLPSINLWALANPEED